MHSWWANSSIGPLIAVHCAWGTLHAQTAGKLEFGCAALWSLNLPFPPAPQNPGSGCHWAQEQWQPGCCCWPWCAEQLWSSQAAAQTQGSKQQGPCSIRYPWCIGMLLFPRILTAHRDDPLSLDLNTLWHTSCGPNLGTLFSMPHLLCCYLFILKISGMSPSDWHTSTPTKALL